MHPGLAQVDDFAGIEDPRRVEGPLDALQQLEVLGREEPGEVPLLHPADSVLPREDSAEGGDGVDDRGVEGGQSFPPFSVL